jgi:putative transposase
VDTPNQYTAVAFGCDAAVQGAALNGVRPYTGSVGDAHDNAMAGAVFATLEGELLDRRSFRSRAEARMAVFHVIEGFCNPAGRHSVLGWPPPIEYDARAMAESDRSLAARRPRARGNVNSNSRLSCRRRSVGLQMRLRRARNRRTGTRA